MYILKMSDFLSGIENVVENLYNHAKSFAKERFVTISLNKVI